MKTYKQLMESLETPEQKNIAIDWIANQMDNTDRTHMDIKAEFLKAYPNQEEFFENVVDSLL